MERRQALVILEALANGIDPFTGEIYPAESPYQNPQTIRAIFMAIRALDAENEPAKKEAKPPLAADGSPLKKAGSAWDAEEDEALREAYLAGSTVADLSEAHQRTNGAIRSRLLRIGLIQDKREAR